MEKSGKTSKGEKKQGNSGYFFRVKFSYFYLPLSNLYNWFMI